MKIITLYICSVRHPQISFPLSGQRGIVPVQPVMKERERGGKGQERKDNGRNTVEICLDRSDKPTGEPQNPLELGGEGIGNDRSLCFEE